MSVTRKVNRLDKLKKPHSGFHRGAKIGAVRYRSFLRERFLAYSRPGGGWKNLKPATIAAKIRMGSRTPTLKLRRTDLLFNSLNPIYTGRPGQLEILTPNGIEIGIGGSGAYPSGITIGEIAEIHQEGLGRVPQRTIVVRPPKEVLDLIKQDISSELVK